MARVPFAFDINDGLVTVRGTVSLDGDDVVVEASRSALQMVPMGTETFRIPSDEIEHIDLQTGLVRAKLMLRPFAFSFIEGFPGDPDEELALPVKRKHRAAAETLVREVRLRNLPR